MSVLGKISLINYRIATHKGDAIRRLGNQVHILTIIPADLIPKEYRKENQALKKLVDIEMGGLGNNFISTSKVGNIHNSTAIKYIKLLISIEDKLSNEKTQD
jgi:hypothetical protein